MKSKQKDKSISIWQIVKWILTIAVIGYTVYSFAFFSLTWTGYEHKIPLYSPQKTAASINQNSTSTPSSTYAVDISNIDNVGRLKKKVDLTVDRFRLEEQKAEIREKEKQVSKREQSLK